MQFQSFDLNTQPLWKKFWDASAVHTADCSFANLYGWAPSYGLDYNVADGLFWIRTTKRGSEPMRLWMPLGVTKGIDWEKALSAFPSGTLIERVPLALAEEMRLGSSRVISLEATRGEDEYLYFQKEMAALSGRKLHKKRTHANTYERLYGVDYRTLSVEKAPEIYLFCSAWLKMQEDVDVSLERELVAIKRMLELWRVNPAMRAGGLYVDNVLVGFALGEALDGAIFDINIEKALPQYRGIYQALVKYFAEKTVTDEFTYIDREQDLGDAGLRFSKMTYQPVDFLKKAKLTLA